MNENGNPQAIAEAMDKIRDEMAKEKGAYVRVVGEYLTLHLQDHPEDAAAILAKDKTIRGSLAQVKAAARKEKDEDGVAALSDEAAFGIVLQYYGIAATGGAGPVDKPKPKPEPAKPTPMDDLSLDALLERLPGGQAEPASADGGTPQDAGETRDPAKAEGAGREGVI